MWMSIPCEGAFDDAEASACGRFGAGARVLLIEPHPRARAATLALLSCSGATVTTADDTAQAVAMLTSPDAGRTGPGSFAPDCNLVIYVEPDCAGLDSPFARTMLECFPDGGPRMIRLVPISALAGLDVHATPGVHAWLPKPVTASALREAVLETRQALPAQRLAIDSGLGPLPAPGARVLLGEDNAVNAEIAKELLVELGFSVVRAADGAQAVACFDHEPFDLILMDCQMPGMDGFEATARIRQLEAARTNDAANPANTARPAIPIIALTANTLSGDRERCIAAGMNDHLGKPFRRAQLRALLTTWLAVPATLSAGHRPDAEGSGTTATPAVATPAIIPAGTIDLGAFSERLGIGGAAGEALMRRVAGMYLRDTPAMLQALGEALQRDDRREVERILHTLRSSSEAIGADALAALCGVAEADARASALDAVRAQARSIADAFAQAGGELAILLRERAEPQPVLRGACGTAQ